MSLRKVGVVGAFAFGTDASNGQTVKTKTLKNALEKHAKIEVVAVDSHGWKKRPIALYREIRAAFKTCDAVVMLPAHNGVRVFGPLLARFKRKFGKKIFYDAIGGWLPEFLADKKRLAKTLRTFDGVWVETETMKAKLVAQGFDNVTVVPNFKEIEPLDESELVYPQGEPLRLCTFSRVMREKGIEDAANAVATVNRELGRNALTLDVYGPVDAEFQERFDEICQTFSNCVRYCGRVDADKSVETLKNYFALLFPTYYDGEGFAGTLIDAFSAGVPVVATDWRYNKEIVDDKTGVLYPTGDQAAFVEILKNVATNPTLILSKKKACLAEANKYRSENAVKTIVRRMEL